MSNLSAIILDIFGICLAATVYGYCLFRSFAINTGHRSFRRAVFFLMMLLISNILIMSAKDAQGQFFYYQGLISACLFFILQAITLYFWFRFTIEELGGKTKTLWQWLYTIPIFIIAGFSIASMFVPNLVFYIDPTTYAYSRGTLYNGIFWWVTSSISYVYFLGSIIVLIMFKKNVNKFIWWGILASYLFTVGCNLLEVAYPGLETTWPGASLTMLWVFLIIILQNVQYDSLTGLNNRKQLEDYLYDIALSRSTRRHKYIIGVMLDLNDFKQINDNYGHKVGDQALKEAADILKESTSMEDFVSRYAGDEFVIIISTNDLKAADKLQARIETNEKAFNSSLSRLYQLHFAFGSVLLQRDKKIDVPTFLDLIDEKMYEDKRRIHGEE